MQIYAAGKGRLCPATAVVPRLTALARVVDVCMLWGDPLKATAAFMEEVYVVARQTNHCLTLSVLIRTERCTTRMTRERLSLQGDPLC